jgi:hypothetical protein
MVFPDPYTALFFLLHGISCWTISTGTLGRFFEWHVMECEWGNDGLDPALGFEKPLSIAGRAEGFGGLKGRMNISGAGVKFVVGTAIGAWQRGEHEHWR